MLMFVFCLILENAPERSSTSATAHWHQNGTQTDVKVEKHKDSWLKSLKSNLMTAGLWNVTWMLIMNVAQTTLIAPPLLPL